MRCHHTVVRQTSPFAFCLSNTQLDVCLTGSAEYIFQGLFGDKGFLSQDRRLPCFPTITMPDHHYTNGGALAFQGASIKEGKKSCSRRGEIHFVPSSNICCSRPGQKDARIKPKSPLIYCNDRQTDRQAERMTICGREGEKGKDKNNFCLTVCHFLVLFCVHVSTMGVGGGLGKAGCQIKLRCLEYFMPHIEWKIIKTIQYMADMRTFLSEVARGHLQA